MSMRRSMQYVLVEDKVLRKQLKIVILPPMHFSRHISQTHSTFSLLAALLLRTAR